jgi:Tol biopolymer transport system component/DNA-binding winged helix-turn-helix (wHTH) protein
MSLGIKHLYEFGEFRLDTENRILIRAGEAIALTPKVFEMLCIFVESRGRLIGKEELMQKIWAESFVEESNLTFNIRQLRKALDDDAQSPVYIKTVPRHGYRFIAEVKTPEAADLAEKLAVEPPAETVPKEPPGNFLDHIELSVPPKSLGAALPLIAAFTLLITTLATVSWVWHNFPARAEGNAPILAADFKSQKLTNTGGVFQAVISPDGKRMAYSSEINNRQSIWIREFETSENIQILPNSEEFYYGLKFSRDGQTLYFARGKDTEKISIYRVSILGGVPKEVAGDTEGWLSLSPDDRQISFVRCDSRRDDEYCSLFVAETDGKNERKILSRPRPIRIGDNQFSPDGKSIAFAVGQSNNASNEFNLREVELATGTERELTAQKFYNVRHLSWLADQSGLLITASERYQMPTKIYRVSRSTGESTPLPKDSNHYNQISLDDRAEKMVVTQFFSDFRLWLAPSANLNAPQIISHAQSGFDYAPSGKLVYGSMTDGSQNIWLMNGDGTEQRQLTNGQGVNWQPQVSPDEKFIYFSSNRSGSVQVWRMNIDGSNQTQISDDEGGRPIFVTNDGNTVYYTTPLSNTLKKVTIGADGQLVSGTVSGERLYVPAIDPTGETVAYFARKNGSAFEISLMTVADGKIFKSFNLPDEKALPVKIVWAKDGRSFYYLTKIGSRSTIRKIAPESGKSELLTEMRDHEITDFEFSPDGETFAFICGGWKHDAYLIEGLK